MKMWLLSLLLALFSSVQAADPLQVLETIRLPSESVTTVQVPAKPITLTKNRLYLFDSDVPVVAKAYPEGLVSITKEEGPLKQKGFWADFPEQKEASNRMFKGKFVYELAPLKTGEITLVVTPIGFKSESEIKTRKLSVNIGDTPVPSPDVTPPKPVDPVVIPPSEFRAILVWETSANMSQEQRNAINSPKVRGYLDRKTVKDEKGRPSWRAWDKDEKLVNQSETWNKIWEATKPQLKDLPAVVVIKGTDGVIHPFKDEAELMKILETAGGK